MDTVFFVASKLFWVVVRPESWLVFMLCLALIEVRRGLMRRATGFLVTCFALIGSIGIFPLGEAVVRPLESRFPASPALTTPAGIVILGGAEGAQASRISGLPELNQAGERLLLGLALARSYPEAQVIFTGGSGALLTHGHSGADVAERIFAQMGLPQSRTLLENASRNTAENATLTLKLLDGGHDGPWVIVTSAFHMPRAIGTFCAAGWENLVPYPVDFRGGGISSLGWNFAEGLSLLNTGVKEWLGLVAYRMTGRMSTLFTAGC
jgi:uncharacterized SAM-binding protein YcdF (DUF218 family)